jgi:hypothetical protein
MSTWKKWLLAAAVLALPSVGYAFVKAYAQPECPIPGCPCAAVR